jgi:hypothetical protein
MLDQQAIIKEAIAQTKSQYNGEQAVSAILAESRTPNTIILREGNTLFFVNYKPKDKYTGMFRALNADVPSRYLKNSIEFIKAVGLMGMKILISDFKDPTILNIFKYISRNPPFPNMGYQAFKLKDGGFRAVINFGNNEKGVKKPSPKEAKELTGIRALQ